MRNGEEESWLHDLYGSVAMVRVACDPMNGGDCGTYSHVV